jgi:hypothetical protein
MNESELNGHSVKKTVFLCTPIRPVEGVQVQILCFLTSHVVVSFASPLPYPRGKSPRCPLNKIISGTQGRYESYGEKEISCPYWELNSRTFSP